MIKEAIHSTANRAVNVPIESIQYFGDFVKGVHASDIGLDSKTSEVLSNCKYGSVNSDIKKITPLTLPNPW